MNKILMPKTQQLFNEMASYLNTDDLDWFQDNIMLKDPNLMFTFDDNILIIRDKDTGVIKNKFRVDVLENIDDDLVDGLEEEEETTEEESTLGDDMKNIASIVSNKETLTQAGLGDISGQAEGALNVYKKASADLINRATETAKKMAGGKE